MSKLFITLQVATQPGGMRVSGARSDGELSCLFSVKLNSANISEIQILDSFQK